jgi:two-component system LytT family response regulator
MLRVFLIDDERVARLSLRALLEEIPGVQIVGEAGGAQIARSLLEKTCPDVVLLDVQMPGTDGFSVIEGLEPNCRVIFVTASDRHAVRAFEVNALDYLVKPVDAARLRAALSRAARPESSLGEMSTTVGRGDVLFLPLDGGRAFVPLDGIRRITCARNVSTVWMADGRRFAVRRSLDEWEQVLHRGDFQRIRRDILVHVPWIERLDAAAGPPLVHVRGEAEPLPVSRRALPALRRALARFGVIGEK